MHVYNQQERKTDLPEVKIVKDKDSGGEIRGSRGRTNGDLSM